MSSYKALLLDIEGTITSISFVKDELFPYAFNNVDGFLTEHFDEPGTQMIIEDIRRLSEEISAKDFAVRSIREPKSECIEDVTRNVRHWINQDKKLTPMKALQGMIWEEAYQRGEVKGHLFEDVPPVLRKLHEHNYPVYIYSSGSVHAQKLLFANSVYGDVTKVLQGYFDTNIGHKGEASSYKKISEQIGVSPADILFLTDIEQEARAASSAGVQAKLVIREGNAELSEEAKKTFEVIRTLDEII